MYSFLILLISTILLASQIAQERKVGLFSPYILFQVYYLIQLPLNLFLGTNFNSPRFSSLSVHTPSEDIILLGSYILIGQIAFIAGFRLFKFNFSGFSGASKTNSWSKTYVNYMCFAMFVFGYLVFSLLVRSFGGYQSFIDQAYVFRTDAIIGQGWLIFMFTSLLSVTALAVLINNEDSFRGKVGLFRLFILLGLCVLPASQLGYRSFVLIPFLQFLFFYNERIKKIRLKAIAIIGAVFVLVFTITGIVRGQPYSISDGSYFDYLVSIYHNRPDLFFSLFFRSMGADITLTTIDYINVYGAYRLIYPIFVEAFTIFVPGGIWAGKPIPLSLQYSQEVFSLNGGVSATVVGEGYWHAGLLGVILLCVMCGLLCRYFVNVRKAGKFSQAALLVCLSIFPSMFLIAESFQGYFNSLVLILLFDLMVLLLISFGNSAAVKKRYGSRSH